MIKAEAPTGTVSEHVWNKSKVFPGTTRQYFVYQPAQYDSAKPTAVIIFQDGHNYINPTGDFRVTTVLENLIHTAAIPGI